MRRLVTVFCLAMLGVGLSPAPAHAYFWEWIDSLSGPRYFGFQVEWRVWCQSNAPAQRRKALQRIKTDLLADKQRYESAWAGAEAIRKNELERVARESVPGRAATADPRKVEPPALYRKAVDFITLGETAVDVALDMLDAEPGLDLAYLAHVVTAAKLGAEQQFAAAAATSLGVPATVSSVPTEAPAVTRSDMRARFTSGVGLSLCDVTPGSRDKRFAKLNFGWGYDRKDKVNQSRVQFLGASIHNVVTPYVVIGTGAGLATFSSATDDRFFKFYVQPTIVDFHFLNTRKQAQEGGPWWPVPHLRYSNIIFPTGFEPGRFNGELSPRFPMELTHSLSIHFDLSSVIRHFQGTWKPQS